MYPGTFAATTPDKPAVVRPATGEVLTYRDLDDASLRLANHLDGLGLRPGDTIAMISTNDLRMLVVYWAAVRSGMYITAVNHHLTADEIAYILGDCTATAVFVDGTVDAAVDAARAVDALSEPGRRIAWGPTPAGFDDYDRVLLAAPATPRPDQPRGADMLYSSGTTGRPKGIKAPLPDGQVDEVPDLLTTLVVPLYGFGADTVYLSPAPLYHAAPLRYCGSTTSVGGTVVVMDRFEALDALRLIEEYGVTHSQWVPTMFVRMLKLPAEDRERHDVSSLRVAIVAAAPCPAEVKQAMAAWWGPVVYEYYSSTEAAGLTFIKPDEAASHPGSVGRAALGIVHICDDDGVEVAVGEIGTIYFERDEMPFAYHNDPEKTRAAQHPDHDNWATTGDIGRVDADGYLYLTDRKAFMLISGGVNIYPQESENVIVTHPEVYDTAVIGVPDDELGEIAVAIVQPMPDATPGPDLAASILDHARSAIAAYKVPRRVEFTAELPRTPTGKLVKAQIRREYLAGQASSISS